MKDIMIRRATDVHRPVLDIMIEKVNESVMNKDFFFIDDWDGLIRQIYEQGFTLIAYCEGEAVGFLSVLLPGRGEDNLGYDISMAEQELNYVAHIEIAAVVPEFRGNKLQTILTKKAEEMLRTMGYRYFMGTVHPQNLFSLNNFLACGYRIVMTKKKYGGLDRHIVLKEASVGEAE